MDTNITPKIIELLPVESSQIAAIGHDETNSILAIQFQPNRKGISSVYHYANFDSEQFTAFKESESIGAFFGRNIKPHADKYPYVNVTDIYSGQDEQQLLDGDKDWETKCQNCGQLPTVYPLELCGPCCFGEAETAGGNW